MHQNARRDRIYGMGEIKGPERRVTLRDNVLRSIRQDEVRRAKRYLFVWGATLFASSFGAVLSLWHTFAALSRSGFYSYAFLLATDRDVVLLNFREFSLLLAGSVPFLAITAVLASLLGFFLSLRSFARHARGSFALS